MAPWRLIGTARPHRRILFAVLVVELVLFGGYRYQWWRWARDPSRPGTMLGEGLTVRGDGLGYYAWLRSLLIDGDWSFDNEFDAYNAVGDGVQPALPRTRLGCRVNPYSVGPACAWSLAVVPGHFALHLLQRVGVRCVTDGYAWPYQLLVGGASLLFAGLGLGFLYGICRRYARPERAALAAAMLTLGTTIVYYSAAEVSMAHGLGTAVTAALVWYWLRTWGSTDPKRWLLVGGLVGLAALARWQLAALAVLPAGEAVLACGRAWRRVGTILARLALAGAASLAAFLPQMVAWRCVYGDWLVAPMPLAHNWLEPNWFRVLLAQDRSLFYWTPLTLLPLLGYLTCFRPGWQPPVLPQGPAPTRGPLLVLIAAFAVQVYFMASVSGLGVFLGAGYGYRQLTEALVLLAPGLALLLEAGSPRQQRVVAVVGCLLVLWNLLLIDQFWAGFLPATAGVNLGTLCSNVGRFTTRGFLFFALLATPFLLAVLPLGRSGLDA